MANVAKVPHGSPCPPPRKRRANDNGGNTAKRKSQKRSSAGGDDDKDKTTEGTNEAPGDGERKEHSAIDGGNTPKKTSAGGDDNEDKATGGANDGSPGDLESLTTHNSREAASSGTQGAESKNDVNGATTLPDGNAETNKQEAGKDAGHNEQVNPSYQTPVWNTTVSKNGFSNLEKHENLTLQLYATFLYRELGIRIFT